MTFNNTYKPVFCYFFSDIVQFLIISALYVAAFCHRHLLSSFTYRLTVSVFGDIIINIITIIILSPVTGSSPSSPSSSTNSYHHRSQLSFHSAALSVLCVMLQIQQSFGLNVIFALPFNGQTAVVSAPNVNLDRVKLNWT